MKVNGNKLRGAAPALYKASKSALSFLLQADSIPIQVRQPVLDQLQGALDSAEEGAVGGHVTLVVTHVTANVLTDAVKKADDGSPESKRLIVALQEGARKTKQRVYIKLWVDLPVIYRLRTILTDENPRGSLRAFSRLVEQLDHEVLSKSPLQLLAESGA